MSIGLTVTKAQLDDYAGQLSLNLRVTFEQLQQLHAYLTATADADLEAKGYTTAEVATLKSGIADLAELATVYKGEAAVTPAKDFTAFAKLLYGVGFTL